MDKFQETACDIITLHVCNADNEGRICEFQDRNEYQWCKHRVRFPEYALYLCMNTDAWPDLQKLE